MLTQVASLVDIYQTISHSSLWRQKTFTQLFTYEVPTPGNALMWKITGVPLSLFFGHLWPVQNAAGHQVDDNIEAKPKQYICRL